MFSVYEGDEAGFFAFEEIFDQDAAAGIAEGVRFEHVLERGAGLLACLGQDHALARGQAVGFDDHGRRAFLDMAQGRLELGEFAEAGGGCAGGVQHLFGEALGAFEHGGGGGRAEAGEARSLHLVDDACYQRRLRAGNDKFDAFVERQRKQTHILVRITRHVADARFAFRSGVAGGDEDFSHAGRGCEFPGQRVFAAAGAGYEDSHVLLPIRLFRGQDALVPRPGGEGILPSRCVWRAGCPPSQGMCISGGSGARR